MHSVALNESGPTEVSILARVLGNEHGNLSLAMARYLLDCGFSDADKARMHDLALRNQNDVLSQDEKDELEAFAKAGSVLSILKSRARRVVRAKEKKRS